MGEGLVRGWDPQQAIRTRTRTVGGTIVHEQVVSLRDVDTWFAYADAVAFAQNRHHLTVLNNTSAPEALLKLRKLFALNLSTGAIAGAVVRFDVKRARPTVVDLATVGGTRLTPVPADTTNRALDAGIYVGTGNTGLTEGPVLFPFLTVTEEVPATQGLTVASFQQQESLLFEGPEIQEIAVRGGEGVTVKQITNTAVGSFGWLLLFTLEPT